MARQQTALRSPSATPKPQVVGIVLKSTGKGPKPPRFQHTITFPVPPQGETSVWLIGRRGCPESNGFAERERLIHLDDDSKGESQPLSRVHLYVEIRHDMEGEVSMQMRDAKCHEESATQVSRNGCVTHLLHGCNEWKRIQDKDEVRICPVYYDGKVTTEYTTLTYTVDCPSLTLPVERTIKALVPDSAIGSVIGRGGSNKKEVQSTTGASLEFSQQGKGFPGGHQRLRVVKVEGMPQAILPGMRTIVEHVHSLEKVKGRLGANGELLDGFGIVVPKQLAKDSSLLKAIDNPPTGEIYKDEQALYLKGTVASILHYIALILKHKHKGTTSVWTYEDPSTKNYPPLAKAKKQPGDDDMEEDDEKEPYVKKHYKGKRAMTKARAKSHRAKTKRKKVDKQQQARGTYPKARKGMANSFKPSAQSPKHKRFKARQGGNR